MQISIKLPFSLKKSLSEVANVESADFSSIVRSFLEYGLASYREGHILRVGDDDFMKSFRKELRVGDEVIASGIYGVIRSIESEAITLEIADAIIIKVWKESVSDLLSPLEDRALPTLEVS
ncbi:MAG: preprotein translocase subunit YajC [Oligoflexales bacterium]